MAVRGNSALLRQCQHTVYFVLHSVHPRNNSLWFVMSRREMIVNITSIGGRACVPTPHTGGFLSLAVSPSRFAVCHSLVTLFPMH